MSEVKIYEVGTLRYNLPQLIAVCAWILLATLALNLLAYKLVSTMMPLLLDQHKVSARNIALILSTIPSAMNFFICPFISTLSDKTRTRWGRRIPFLAVSTPFVVGFMILIGFEPKITAALHGIINLPVNTIGFGLLAMLTILFQMAYLVPGAIIYYIFADVIPKQFIGTFMGVSTFFGTGITFVFNYFILDPAVKHPDFWFPLIGLLYFAAYLGLSLFVKEGSYPPVCDKIEQDGSWLKRMRQYIVLYFRECCRRRIFIMLFVSTGLTQASCVCRSMFNLLFATKDLGMTVGAYGKVIAWGALIGAVIVLPMGRVMDRLHPLRIFIGSGLVVIAMNVWGYFCVTDAKSFTVVGIAIAVIYAVQFLAQTPLLIALLPTEKFGQFASANSMVNCFIMLFAGYFGGWATDLFGYRMIFIWDFTLTIAATFTLLVVYHDWKKFGGQAGYQPPPVD